MMMVFFRYGQAFKVDFFSCFERDIYGVDRSKEKKKYVDDMTPVTAF